ncbi:MAG: glycosyltransferase family 87 protein [Terracidiphilus sp.]
MSVVLQNAVPMPLTDFRALYYPSRCLLQHHDPYMQSEVLRLYRAEGGDRSSDTAETRQVATQDPYPPTAFTFTIPFAMLSWGPAKMLWTLLSMGSLIFASLLIWDLGADYAPILSGTLIGFLLANSEVLIITGNAAGIAISLCAVAVWCFFRERFVPAGILCLAASLAIKPHDAGLVWLYLLLAGGVYRKRALQTLLATIALSLPGVLWVWLESPHWIQEMYSNLLAYTVHNGLNDPRNASMGPEGIIDLQTNLSVLWNDPHFYNLASYLIFVPLLLILAFVSLRTRPSPKRSWLALAAVAPLTLLPVYHRQFDAKLLLLTVPACALLWAEGGRTGKFAALVNVAGFAVIGDLTWVTAFGVIHSLHLSRFGLPGQIEKILPVPPTLLAVSVFYLWVYVRSTRPPVERQDSDCAA